MHSYVKAATCLLLILPLVYGTQNQTSWSVKDRFIYLGNERFIFKGVNYSPVPIGESQSNGDRGDVFTKKWSSIHERDIPKLREISVNSIRIYNCYPWRYPSPTLLESTPATENDHTEFLDMLWNNGVDPIYVWITHYMGVTFHMKKTDQEPNEEKRWQIPSGQWVSYDPLWLSADMVIQKYNENAFLALARKYGNHPAVVGFVIGNEQNSELARGSIDFWKWFDNVAAKIKKIAPKKLTMLTLVDDANLSVAYAEKFNVLNNVDVWGVNSYRGTEKTGFDVLFSEYASLSNKPLLITEYGPPASTRNEEGEVVILENNAELQAQYIRVHWDDIMQNRHIASGGYIFTWTDEWWKAGQPKIQNVLSGSENFAYPGRYGDEEYYGMNAISLGPVVQQGNKTIRGVDILHPRASVGLMSKVFKLKIDPVKPYPPAGSDITLAPLEKPYYDSSSVNDGNLQASSVPIWSNVIIASGTSYRKMGWRYAYLCVLAWPLVL